MVEIVLQGLHQSEGGIGVLHGVVQVRQVGCKQAGPPHRTDAFECVMGAGVCLLLHALVSECQGVGVSGVFGRCECVHVPPCTHMNTVIENEKAEDSLPNVQRGAEPAWL